MKHCPKISIVILNYNGKDVLKSCLFSVLGINYPNLETIVVDNCSSDGSLEEAKKDFPETIFLENRKNLGYAAGNNIGIKKALENGAEFVMLLNNDTEVTVDLFEKTVPVMEKNKKIGIASPLVFKGSSKEVWFSGGKINWLSMKAIHKTSENKRRIKNSDFISGCAMIIRKEVLEKIGLLDESFFLYWEDADFSLRAKKAGFSLVVLSDARIKHYEKSEERKPEKVYWLVLSGLIFFSKHAKDINMVWIKIYTFLRRIKNRVDITLGNKKEFALAVRRAYADFNKLKR